MGKKMHIQRLKPFLISRTLMDSYRKHSAYGVMIVSHVKEDIFFALVGLRLTNFFSLTNWKAFRPIYSHMHTFQFDL